MTQSTISRRSLLAMGAVALAPASPARATPPVLRIERRIIAVAGKAATVLGVRQPNGTHGLVLEPGQRFQLRLENHLNVDSIIHWHGQTPPYGQDGVGDAAETVLRAGMTRDYDFVARPGTHWMHSHFGLQEQALLAAPLVVRDGLHPEAQDVTVLLRDFTWKDADVVLAGLRQGGHGGGHGAHAGHAMAHPLNDVIYDAYLANDRALDDPEVFRVSAGGLVRLRLINGATASQFWIDLGAMEAELVAVDGNPVVPVAGRVFPLANGQRMDLLVRMPRRGVVPVLAQVEGLRARTGFVLATPDAAIARIAPDAPRVLGAVDMSLERRLKAPFSSLLPGADVALAVALTGGNSGFAWGMNGKAWGQHAVLEARVGQVVRIDMTNSTPMAHPMHLHGHHFRVVALDGMAVAGAERDTVLVPAAKDGVGGRVSIQFRADNPGRWLLHCHNLYHMAAGMMTELAYG